MISAELLFFSTCTENLAAIYVTITNFSTVISNGVAFLVLHCSDHVSSVT